MSAPCPHCAGTGHTLDQLVTAAAMRQLRLDAAVPVARLAAAMGRTRSYAYQLERADKRWTPQLVAAWQAALDLLAKSPPPLKPRRASRQPTTALSGVPTAPRTTP